MNRADTSAAPVTALGRALWSFVLPAVNQPLLWLFLALMVAGSLSSHAVVNNSNASGFWISANRLIRLGKLQNCWGFLQVGKGYCKSHCWSRKG